MIGRSTARLNGVRERQNGANFRSNIDESVGIVEWQFPWETADQLATHPLQNVLRSDPAFATSTAIYPNWASGGRRPAPGSERNDPISKHGAGVYGSFVAGRRQFTKPLLLNLNDDTPRVLERMIREGVRVFSFSSAIRGQESKLSKELEKVIKNHPEVLFFVATPHIAGNNIPVGELNETPSRLALQGVPNVILVGCLEHYPDNILADQSGKKLGTAKNPFVIDNQPFTGAQQLFMMNGRSTQAVGGLPNGGTSAATAHLASLTSMVITSMKSRGLPIKRENIMRELKSLMHKTKAQEKNGTIKDVEYFTIDTILANAKAPLITESIWLPGYTGFPAPKLIRKQK